MPNEKATEPTVRLRPGESKVGTLEYAATERAAVEYGRITPLHRKSSHIQVGKTVVEDLPGDTTINTPENTGIGCSSVQDERVKRVNDDASNLGPSRALGGPFVGGQQGTDQEQANKE